MAVGSLPHGADDRVECGGLGPWFIIVFNRHWVETGSVAARCVSVMSREIPLRSAGASRRVAEHSLNVQRALGPFSAA